MGRHYRKGFTIVELMIVVVLISIVMYLATPGLSHIYNRITFESLQKNLISHLSFARAEALKQGTDVSLCPSSNGSNCLRASSNWKDGWLIFVDVNRNGTFEPRDDVLIKAAPSPAIADVFWSSNRNISFRSDGSVTAGTQGSFSICDMQGSRAIVRGVTVSTIGRIREDNTVTCP